MTMRGAKKSRKYVQNLARARAREAAYIFGTVFELIDKYVSEKDKARVAKKLWRESRKHDFGPSDMHVDAALGRLDLARKGVDPNCPDDGKVWLYYGDKGFDEAG